MATNLFLVDAFTNKPFSGNPAAVCILEKPQEGKWLQAVAKEMNLSETAFILKTNQNYNLRWFTPVTEVDLCGHGTLSAAHILWESGLVPSDTPINFETKSGILLALKNKDWIELDFPLITQTEIPCPANLIEALKSTPTYTGRKGKADFIVEVENESTLRNLKPNFELLKEICRGIAVTCRSESKEFDFISRYFAPKEGINEDPVTGSAHCCLGPYWAKKLAKNNLTAYQASQRGGVVKMNVKNNRVILSGQALTRYLF
jgi:PhzF family phenazine biosynthesis protein